MSQQNRGKATSSLILHVVVVSAGAVIATLAIGYALFLTSTGQAIGSPVVVSVASFESLSRTSILGVALIAGAAAAVVAYRRQLVTESTHSLEQDRHLQDRYVAASAQLGSDRATIRIAGANALAALAADWEAPLQRQSCVDVLCSYLRMPPQASFAPAAQSTTGNTDGSGSEDHQVRLTIQRAFAVHLNATNPAKWRDISLDLTGAELFDFDLSGCRIDGSLTFADAVFHGRTRFLDVVARTTTFARAEFQGDVEFRRFDVESSLFEHTSFLGDADFESTVLASQGSAPVSFDHVEFSGDARFYSITAVSGLVFGDVEFHGSFLIDASRLAEDPDQRRVEAPLELRNVHFHQEAMFKHLLVGKIRMVSVNAEKGLYFEALWAHGGAALIDVESGAYFFIADSTIFGKFSLQDCRFHEIPEIENLNVGTLRPARVLAGGQPWDGAEVGLGHAGYLTRKSGPPFTVPTI